MNNLLETLSGRLDADAFIHDPITMVGGLGMIGGVIFAAILITYFKRWKWLYREWLTSLDAKKIGVMYIIVAVLMLFRGVADAAMMRVQQALASGDNSGIVSSDTFQQVASAHGTIMIFFVAMGLMFGLINLVLPLIIGARDVAFPFLNSVSFWLFAAGMALVNISLVVGHFSNAGWLAYPPLSGLEYNPTVGIDYWIWSLQLAGIGTTLSGVNFITTILKMRAPGMSLMKMPVFAWSILTTMMLTLFAFPVLTVTLSLLSLDRMLGMNIFTSDFGGNAMMYVNLIWAWGHPEVYILVLPSFGIFSEIVATFSRKRLFGYPSMVAALFGITFLSYVVWLHHFFTMGAGANVNGFFGIMTMIIAIPTGVKIFNWLFTMYGGRIHFGSPMLWFMAFVLVFTVGGVTGVLLAVPAIDFQVHNSLFLVAHFHNTIIGGVLFGYFAGITYWFPKIFGFKLNEKLGKASVYLWTMGFLLAFIPLYILGLMGATRRIDHYPGDNGWQILFIIAGLGLVVIGLGIAAQVLQVAVSIWKRKENRDTTGDPWNGRTLEWSVPSPAPYYNFAVTPVVNSRDSWWETKLRGRKNQNIKYKDIHLPKNSGAGILIAAFALIVGFALVWHMWWLAVLGFLAVVVAVICRTMTEDTEFVVTASELERLDQGRSYGGVK